MCRRITGIGLARWARVFWHAALLGAVWLVPAACAEPACTRSELADKSPRYDARGGEVRDRATGLVWQRCSLGLAWDEVAKACTGERASLIYSDALAAAAGAGSGWRLPTVTELSSLIDDDCGVPALDARIFADVSNSTDEAEEEYWTTTPGGIEDMMYFVDFAYGYRDIRSPGFERRARLVRRPD